MPPQSIHPGVATARRPVHYRDLPTGCERFAPKSPDPVTRKWYGSTIVTAARVTDIQHAGPGVSRCRLRDAPERRSGCPLVVERDFDLRARCACLGAAVTVTSAKPSPHVRVMMRRFGLEDAVRAGAADVDSTALVTRVLASSGGMVMPLGYPSDEEAATVSPSRPAWTPQAHHEPILLAHLLASPTATVTQIGVQSPRGEARDTRSS